MTIQTWNVNLKLSTSKKKYSKRSKKVGVMCTSHQKVVSGGKLGLIHSWANGYFIKDFKKISRAFDTILWILFDLGFSIENLEIRSMWVFMNWWQL